MSLRIGVGVQGAEDLLHGKQAPPLKTLAPSLPKAATADATFLSTIDRGCSSVRSQFTFYKQQQLKQMVPSPSLPENPRLGVTTFWK